MDSISGIDYPRMLADYYTHIIALKMLIEDFGKATVEFAEGNSITFSVIFNNSDIKSQLRSGSLVIYNRPLQIQVESFSDIELKIKIQG